MSSFGKIFKISTYGESHCKSVGVIIDGVPPGIPLTEEDIQPQLTRRRPGQSSIATARQESDLVEIQSGTEFGCTLGTPIGARVLNKDQRPGDYSFQHGQDDSTFVPRPSHADYTYRAKYGLAASSGGGRSSARETIGRVIGGAVAEKVLRHFLGAEFNIVAYVSSVGDLQASFDPAGPGAAALTREVVDRTVVRCPDEEVAPRMIERINTLAKAGDSVGGTVTCIVHGFPPGLGEPVFDRLEAMLAHAMLSIPATKGFEIGSGFEGTAMKGSEANDSFCLASPTSPPFARSPQEKVLATSTNHSGGVQGGISNGMPITFKVAFKPPATIGVAQTTTSMAGQTSVLAAKGRHDPCVVNRAVPIVEAMAALVLLDALLLQRTRMHATGSYFVQPR